MSKKKVVVAMSGGVDSSVCAYLLKEQGYDVIGATMRLVDDEKTNNSIKDAQDICAYLGIKHYVFDLIDEFRRIVIDNFINAYKEGTTPNPCVVCNKYFKFGLFYKKSLELGYEMIATGHFAKIENGKLKFSDTINKDQSYFLYGINKDILEHIIFPLTGFNSKEEVRKIAEKTGLRVSSKKDSQEVCFVPNDDYKAFLELNLGKQELGDICLVDGTVLGKHNGLFNYTIGQRKGLNISYKEPLYVVEIDAINNKIIVGTNDELYKDELIAKDINLLVDTFPEEIYAKVRSRGILKKVKVEFISDKVKVKFMEAERAITKGQSVVFYDADNVCLGGGIIETIL